MTDAPLYTVTPPAELTELAQWVVTMLVSSVDKDGNPTTDKPPKVPNGRGGLRGANHSNPADWIAFRDACEAVAAGLGGAQAVGFVFSDCDPYTGVDLDGCRDAETGEIAPWAARWVAELNTYTEISVSGTGLKLWVRGKLPKTHKVKFGPQHTGIELYSRQRFFWMTGNRLEGSPATIRPAQDVLDRLAQEVERLRAEQQPARLSTTRATVVRTRSYTGRSLYGQFNDENPLPNLLEAYGAQLVRQQGNELLYSGLTGDSHSHVVTYKVSPSSNGGWIGYSYSPNGKLNNADHPRGFDAAAAEIELRHHGNKKAFEEAQRERRPQTTKQLLRATEAPAHVTTAEVGRRATEAARKRQARQQAAAELRAEVEARMAADNTLSGADRAVLEAMLRIAGERGWCRPSKERIAELCGYSLGSVKRSLGLLEGRYFTSEGDGGGPNCTAVRTFLRGSLAGAESGEMIHESLENMISDESQVASEPPPSPGPRDAGDDPDSWCWTDPQHGADELAEPAPAEPRPRPDRAQQGDAPVAPDAALLRYALGLAAEHPGPVPALEELAELELQAWVVAAEALLQAPPAWQSAPTEVDPAELHGPDGAIVFAGGAAWLPTDAARSWWEALEAGRPRPAAAPVPLVEPPAPPSPGPRQVEPTDPVQRTRYYALLGRGARSAREGKGAQAAALRAQAAQVLAGGEVREVVTKAAAATGRALTSSSGRKQQEVTYAATSFL